MQSSATLLVDCRCTLGEGLVWSPRQRSVLWTDIEKSKLWMHRPEDQATRSWTLPDRLGSFALCESGRLVLGLAKSLAFADLDAASGPELQVDPIMPIEPRLARTRINDGRTDRAGNFVFGTYNEAQDAPSGSFYRYLLTLRPSSSRARRRGHSQQHLFQSGRRDDVFLRFAGGADPPVRLRG